MLFVKTVKLIMKHYKSKYFKPNMADVDNTSKGLEIKKNEFFLWKC